MNSIQVKLLAIPFLSLILLLALTPVHAQEDRYTYVFERSFKLHTPDASFTVEYEYSNDVTGGVVPVRSGVASITSNQYKTIFETDLNDIYNVTLIIRYTMPVQQYVLFRLYDAGEMLDYFPIPVYAQTLIFKLSVETSTKPQMPTAKELLNETIPELRQVQETQNIKFSYIEQYLGMLTVISVISLVASLVAIYVKRTSI